MENIQEAIFWFFAPLLAGIVGGGAVLAVAAAISSIVDSTIDSSTVIQEVHKVPEFKNAVKAMIKGKKVREVNLNIFGSNDKDLGTLDIKTSQYVADSLKVGQVIEL